MADEASTAETLIHMAELIAAVTAAGEAVQRVAVGAGVPTETLTYLTEFDDRLSQDAAALLIHLAAIARRLPLPGDPDASIAR